MEKQKILECEGECGELFPFNEMKRIYGYDGKLVLVCDPCRRFIIAEKESEMEYNYMRGGNILHKRT